MPRFIACCILFVLLGVAFLLSLLPLDLGFEVEERAPWVLAGACLLVVWAEASSLNKRGRKQGGKIWSSSLTAVYKFYIPLFLLACYIADGLILGFKLWSDPRYFPIYIVMGIALLPFWIILRYRFKTLCVVGNTFFISTFFKEMAFQLDEIVDFSRHDRYFYHIVVCREGKCTAYIIIPYISDEFVPDFFSQRMTPIEKFRKSLMGQIKNNRKRLMKGKEEI